MSKARQQSITRALKRGNVDIRGNNTKLSSTKLTKSARSLTTVFRPHKFVVQLTDKELKRRDNLQKRKQKECA